MFNISNIFDFGQVHAYIISSLKKDMPAVFGKEAKKKELIKNLDTLYAALQRVGSQKLLKPRQKRKCFYRIPLLSQVAVAIVVCCKQIKIKFC